MSSNGSANVKHSEAMSDEIITAMSTACGASIFLFELFFKKKNLESICCPSYEMNAGSWQAWVLITKLINSKIINFYKWEALISFLGKKKEKTCRREKLGKKKIVHLSGRVLNAHPSFFPSFPIQYTNALR